MKANWQGKGEEDPENYANTFEGRVSNKYLSGDYPHFLRPSKIYPYRRLEDMHIKDAMEDALERYEKDLLGQEKERDKHRFNQQKAHMDDMLYMQDQEEKKRRDREETKVFLRLQMEESKSRKAEETKKLKEFTKTHFGPEEDPFTNDFQRQQEMHKKVKMHSTLQAQMEENSREKSKWER